MQAAWGIFHAMTAPVRHSDQVSADIASLANPDHPALLSSLAQYQRVTRSPLPAPVVDAAKRAIVDWFAVTLAGMADPQTRSLAAVARGWQSGGRAFTLDGHRMAPAPAALINGAAAHTLDFDDFHIASLLHPGAPTFAAVLALGYGHGLGGTRMLAAFAAGYEVGARLGLEGVGERLAARGWHPTSILGHFSAVAGAAAVLELDPKQFASAIGLAAAQAGGLMSLAGSFAKPVAVGKAAMNGVLAAEMAAAGIAAPDGLLDDPVRGLFGTLLQEPRAAVASLDANWLTLENTYKPYPSCQLTHAAHEAALEAGRSRRDRMPDAVVLTVHPLAPVIACHQSPETVLEARFSLPYNVAIGLQGRRAVLAEFSDQGLADAARQALASRVRVTTDPGVARWAARLHVEYPDGTTSGVDVPAALGSLDRPMEWTDLDKKFMDTVEPLMRAEAPRLLDALKRFDSVGAPDEVAALISGTVVRNER